MQYRKDKNGNEISVLGYGCMRFTKEGGHADIDKAEKEVMAAIDAGVNYLDTAYVYAGNEAAVGGDPRAQSLQGTHLPGKPSCRTTRSSRWRVPRRCSRRSCAACRQTTLITI